MLERLEAIKARDDITPIGDIRGLGAMVAFETVEEEGGNTPKPEAALAVVAKARELGLIILPCGYWGNTVRLLAPLTVPMEHLEEGLDILEQSLEQSRVEIAA
jgi:4-aminobutyrate aminotransferase-like enzyme